MWLANVGCFPTRTHTEAQSPTIMTHIRINLHTYNEYSIFVFLMVFDKIGWCVFDGYGNQGESFISGNEPDNFRTVRILFLTTAIIQGLCMRAIQR